MPLRSTAVLLSALTLALLCGCSNSTLDGGAPARAAREGGTAAAVAAKVAVPRGLNPCTADGLSASGMERTAAALGGEPLGCFQSSATTELHGAQKNLTTPAEFAVAVKMKGGPYTATDVAKLMSDVTEGWKSAKPLSQDTRADYERRIGDLIEKSTPTGTPKPADSTHPAVLVSIEQLGPQSFAVVAIRQGPRSLHGEFFNITKVDAAAVVLRQAALTRLSIARELRSIQDVEAAREEIADWAYAVALGP